jgi:tRNA(Ile)-lysidine synthase
VRELVASHSPSAELHLPDDLIVYREYDWLRKSSCDELSAVQGRWPFKLDGDTVIRELGATLICHPEQSEGALSRQEGTECFDADAMGSEPFVRTWQEGDRFQPLGMNESKKLQDFFVDQKVPRRQRGRIPLLCASDGRIAWVVGVRIAEPFKVTEKTRHILRISFKG